MRIVFFTSLLHRYAQVRFDMNKRSERVLEFNKVLEMLSGCASTDAAKKKAEKISPRTDIAEIQTLQQETRAAFLRMSHFGNLSFSGIRDITPITRALSIKSPLSSAELLTVASLLDAAAAVQSYGDKLGDIAESDILSERFSMLAPLANVSGEIRRCIISEGEIADNASGTLRSIRKELSQADDRLHSKLDKIIKSEAMRDMMQEVLITQRNGRYCIPIKAEYRTRIPGMVHDQSKTGATLFIEPLEIVTFNNQIRELETKEAVEIEKILGELSLMCSDYTDDILFDYKLLTELDFIFAKAKLAEKMKAVEPVMRDDGIVDIKKGIHPLLARETAVPVDIKLGKDYTLLIVTGPNTGGKTVSLKTLGLLTLMGQSGLHVPAMEGTELSVFTDVFADIGDEQSIEQNLSTFSSHMSNIVYITKHADYRSLCLFDEPGGGTDPVEGAALAISILSYLKDKGARVMATTHYSELKTFAISEEGVMNASFEFDLEKMQPTYRLVIGVPGKSNAFAISRRLGLSDTIIDSARERLDTNALLMENAITDLEELRKETEKDKAAIESYEEEVRRLRQSLKDKETNLDKKKADILDAARAEAKELIDAAKEEADRSIREYNKWLKNPSRADISKMEKRRSELRDKSKKLVKEDNSKTERTISGHRSSDFHIGDTVKVISLDTEGHILELPDSKGMALVGMGILSSRVHIDDLLIIEGRADNNANEKKSYAKAGDTSFGKGYTFKPEINLLGKTVDEAVSELDKFLDDAILAHAETVRVVHGKGTGALRKGVHEYLRKKKFVKKFELAEFGEGDAGVTIVKL